jgi:hypothetical protein
MPTKIPARQQNEKASKNLDTGTDYYHYLCDIDSRIQMKDISDM